MLAWLQDEWEQQEMVNFDQFDHLHPDLQRERAVRLSPHPRSSRVFCGL